MPKELFELGHLLDLDSKVHRRIFQKLLKEMGEDCYNRPEDPTARVITLQVTVSPVLKVRGGDDLDHIAVTADWKSKRPTIKGNVYRMMPKVEASGFKGLMFNPDLPDDPEAKSIADIAEEEEAKAKK